MKDHINSSVVIISFSHSKDVSLISLLILIGITQAPSHVNVALDSYDPGSKIVRFSHFRIFFRIKMHQAEAGLVLPLSSRCISKATGSLKL